MLLAGLWGNVVLVALYLASRSPLQLGLHPGHAQVVGDVDLIAIGAEVGVIVALPLLLPPGLRRWTLNALLVVGVSWWLVNVRGLLG